MTYYVDIQHACGSENPIKDDMIRLWAQTTLSSSLDAAELTIRFVEPDEMTRLNDTYRQQPKPTNVLAFPANIPPSVTLECPFLGDIIVCPSVLLKESIDAQSPLEAHWAHIIIHGILHLLGYDHIDETDALTMEHREIVLLSQLGYDNPYQEDHHFE